MSGPVMSYDPMNQSTTVNYSEGVDTETPTISHIQVIRNNLMDNQIPMYIYVGRVVPTHLQAGDCPFCDERAEMLKLKGRSKHQFLIPTDKNIPVSKTAVTFNDMGLNSGVWRR
ncbi:hypothetical protein F4779DRAFT_584521 [Xylariaceae sp. FL0662B]|nr:hypothetical protein F4779DRAFT_584521 [Xylariaceae sp. FL0662B]